MRKKLVGIVSRLCCDERFDGFRLFGDAVSLFRERVDQRTAFLVDLELHGSGRCAHDIQELSHIVRNSKIRRLLDDNGFQALSQVTSSKRLSCDRSDFGFSELLTSCWVRP